MLIEGNETYMLTAGHCFGQKTTGREAITEEVASEYPNLAGQKEIGKEVYRYFNAERDMAEVKVTRPGAFTEALPDPVPALVALWGSRTPRTPQAVEGSEVVIQGQKVCRVGQATSERCGKVLALDVVGGEGVNHLVETDACSAPGDSGGPYFLEERKGMMVGMHIGKPRTGGRYDCGGTEPRTVFEPLKGIRGVEAFGILNTFSTQELLTRANETRRGGC
jgi:hypothetical protein